MTDNHTEDDDREWTPETNVWAISGQRTQTGDLLDVSCRASWCETREEGPNDYRVRRRVEVDLDYHVEDGTARLDSIGERDSDLEADAIDPLVLRAVPAAERAVGNVPGVEHVERIEETLGRPIDDGRAALDNDRQQ